LESFDFTFQPSLDRGRIMALAQLDFIARAEVVHFLGPPGPSWSGRMARATAPGSPSGLPLGVVATALGVAAVKAGRRVYRSTLAELIETLGRAEREGRLIETIRFLGRSSLLIVDEIGYLPITPGGANLFFQLVNARYEKGAMILTSNRGFATRRGLLTASPSALGAKASWPLPGRGLRRSRRRHGTARSPSPPRHHRPDRRRQLPAARPCRSHPGASSIACRHHAAAGAQTPRQATEKGSRPCLNQADRRSQKWGIFARHFWGIFIRHLQSGLYSKANLEELAKGAGKSILATPIRRITMRGCGDPAPHTVTTRCRSPT